MNNSALPYWLSFAVLMAALYGGFKLYQTQNAARGGTSVSDSIDLPPLEQFELTKSDGSTFRSADMKGKVWIASFFFSTCTGTCSRLNGNIAHLSRLPEIEDATWVSISVDPTNDTVPVLEAYAKRFNADPARWIFCRHDDFNYVKRLSQDVMHVGGVSLQGHNDYAVIIDKRGKVAGMFDAVSASASEKGLETIKKCLAEPYDPAGDETQPAAASAGATRNGNDAAPEASPAVQGAKAA